MVRAPSTTTPASGSALDHYWPGRGAARVHGIVNSAAVAGLAPDLTSITLIADGVERARGPALHRARLEQLQGAYFAEPGRAHRRRAPTLRLRALLEYFVQDGDIKTFDGSST